MLVGDDAEWALPAADGFQWCPYLGLQQVSVVRGDEDEADVGEGEVVRIRVTTEVLAGISRTDKCLEIIAMRNATLAESALVLRDDGTLVLACQLTVTHSRSAEGRAWIADLAIRQFITARSLSTQLSGLGRVIRWHHPSLGRRPEPDVWFEQYPEQLRAVAAGRDDRPESHGQVALDAVSGTPAVFSTEQGNDGGGLIFVWRTTRVSRLATVGREIQVTLTPGTEEARPAWVIRSRLPLTGTETEKARWCNDRNAELLLDPESAADVTVTGGWGLDEDGEVCLTTGLARAFVRDDEAQAARSLAYLLRQSQKIVMVALDAAGTLQVQFRPPSAGWFAAAALRARLLRSLGAEPQWLIGGHDAEQIVWRSGPATTAFEVAEGTAGTPDLGVLHVYTLVAAGEDGEDARTVCAQLNAHTGTARWSVAREQNPDGSYSHEVQVSCAFVAGPQISAALESFALWCVREQIATATAHIRSRDVATAISGSHIYHVGFPGGDSREDPHPVVSFIERVVLPSAWLSASLLADEWLTTFLELRQQMRAERTSAWFAREEKFPLTYETPFSWDSGWDTDQGGTSTRETALVEAELAQHPEFGNGLRIAMYVPRGSGGDGYAVNAVNRLDTEVTGASHSFGGWTEPTTGIRADALACVIFLPAAFAEIVASWPLAMREIALTLARQALLARRALVPQGERSWEDYGARVGLAMGAAPPGTPGRNPLGLAWGEARDGDVKAVS